VDGSRKSQAYDTTGDKLWAAEFFLHVPSKCLPASLIVKQAQYRFKDFRENGLKMRSSRRILCIGRSRWATRWELASPVPNLIALCLLQLITNEALEMNFDSSRILDSH